ncbi:hypothetical protein NMU03_03880 [Allocoprobacillus halotolerans]|uniref:O-antigen ligase-like membrane protein n=1 Tax=Allocoprobacillus halotolerans TaxID=2944914 RepID=A0ABY5I3P6_9FIRM|nr:hypothetical protein [Allocoprobacillus halotolerans]UTY39954.1 hypothetical protein NMU03_03880 [Allocoprobacillus halotolerans]
MKLLNTKIDIKIIKQIILWIVFFILLFKIRIFNIDLTKYIFVIVIIYLFLHLCEVRSILNKIGIKHYIIYVALGFFWASGLLYREIFYVYNSSSSYMFSKELIVSMLYLFVMPIFIIMVFKNSENFERTISSVAIAQSIIVISSLFLDPVKSLLSLYYSYDKEYLFYISASVKGIGIGVVGAAGSIVLFSSQVLLLFMMLKGKITVSNFFVKYLIIMIAEAISGRTGFYCAVALLIFWLITEKRDNILYDMRKVIPKIIIITIFLFLIVYLFKPELIGRIVNRSLELFYGLFNLGEGSQTFDVLSKMDKPALTLETLFGTSVTKGISQLGTKFQNDSGYWQKFFALGLFGSIAYYISFLQLYLLPIIENKLKNKIFYFFILAIMFIIEIKEPFFSYMILPMMFMAIINMDILSKQ